MTYSRYLGLNMGRRMTDSLAGWVHASLSKGCLILGHRFLSQRVLVPSVLLLSASGLCFCLVLLVLSNRQGLDNAEADVDGHHEGDRGAGEGA